MRHELAPEGPVFGIAGVELGRLGLRGRLDGRVALLDSILGQAIEPRQLAHGIGRVARLVARVFPSPEDHAELRAPVAQMVVSNHTMAQRRVDPGQAVADHRRAQVPHVHRLGDIGRGEVDDDRLRPWPAARGPSVSSVNSSPNAAATHASCSRILRNPGPATSGGAANGARSTGVASSAARSRGWRPTRLGQRHAAIGLIVAKLGIGRRRDGLVKGRPIDSLGQGRAKRFAQASE